MSDGNARHTSAHRKDENGRSLEIEGYIQQGLEWMSRGLGWRLPYGLGNPDGSRPPLSVLDMGCDYGYALQVLHGSANRALIRSVGIDPFYSSNPFGFDLRRHSMDDPTLPFLLQDRVGILRRARGGFDLAVLNHSLEHVPNPYLVMQNVRALLKPSNSVVFIAVPDERDPWSRWEGHYTIWTKSWLVRFMQMNGFRPIAAKVVELRPDHHEIWGLFELVEELHAELCTSLDDVTDFSGQETT